MLLPALGGKIRDLTMAGRQWLWHNPSIPFAEAAEGSSFELAGDSGGFDECAPTLAECKLPTWVKGAADALLPSHGDLWSQRPEFSIDTGVEGHTAVCVWRGARLPYRLTRAVTVHPDASVTFSYAVENLGTHRLPFLWSAHPLFPLTAVTRIELPEGARTRVGAQHGVDFGHDGIQHHWPRLLSAGTLVDLSRPEAAFPVAFACKLFVELPRHEVTVALIEGNARLEMRFSGAEIPFVGVWINRGGWSPFPPRRSLVDKLFGKRREPYANCGIEPCLAAPDSLTDAVGAWDSAHWIEPGAASRWSMNWRGVVVD